MKRVVVGRCRCPTASQVKPHPDAADHSTPRPLHPHSKCKTHGVLLLFHPYNITKEGNFVGSHCVSYLDEIVYLEPEGGGESGAQGVGQ